MVHITKPKKSKEQSQELSFAECVLPTPFNNESKKYGTLEFIHKDGSTLKLNGFSAQNLLPIVSLFLTGKP